MNSEEGSQPTEISVPGLVAEVKSPPTVSQRIAWGGLEITAPVVWLYILTKLFILDIDRLILGSTAPKYIWLLDFRLFILMGGIAILWMVFGNKNTLIWFLYIIFYPLILICWKIPYFVFKQKSWTLAFALINSVTSFFKSFKYSFITAALFLGALAVSVAFTNRILLWGAVIVLLVIITVNYIRKFWLALKPSSLFGVHIKLLKGVRNRARNSFVPDASIKDILLTNLNEQQLQKRTENLQTAVLFNRVCLFAARKLQDYQSSGWQFVPSVLTILGLVIFTVIAFAGVYYSLFKLDPTLYSFTYAPSLFTFFYFSFNHLVFNGIPGLEVAKPLSQSISMLQEFYTFILGAIFVTLYISVQSEKHSIELREVIDEIRDEGASMEGLIRDEYQLNSIADAMVELERLKAGLVGFLLLISKNI